MGAASVFTPYGQGSDLALINETWLTNTTALATLGSGIVDVVDFWDGNRYLTPPQDVAASGRRVVGPTGNSLLTLVPVGIGGDNESGAFRVWVWRRIVAPNRSKGPVQWLKTLLCQGTFTLCTKVGIAGGILGATVRYADTISISNDRSLGPDQVRLLQGTADESPAMLVVDTLGQLVEIEGTRNGSIATSYNWLIGWLSA